MKGKFVVILVSCASKAEARKIAGSLLKRKAVGCATILEDLESRYWWKGALSVSKECLMIMKAAR